MIQWLIDNKDLATLLFTAVVALSTVVYAVLTALLVFETRQMRKAQTEPRLSAYFEPIEEYVNFGHLYIKNIGLGPAFDISISIKSSGSKEGSEYLINDFGKTKFMEKGINYLAPNQMLRSGYTSMVENYNEKIKSILLVTLDYRSADRKKHKELFTIDFSEIEGYGSLGKPHLYSIAQSLEKIQKDVGHISTGFHKLKVHVYDNEDREREKLEWEETRKIRQRQKQGRENGDSGA